MGESGPRPERERDRRRWTRRIASGVVEVTLLGAVIWAVATGGPFAGHPPTPTPRPPVPTPTPRLYWPTPSYPPVPAGPPIPPPPRGSVGFIGVPPQGAAPSTPVDGELVLRYEGQPDHLKIGPSYRAWVYADGRLIWWMDGSPAAGGVPEGANDWATGYLEQRLTPVGVELLLGRRTPRTALFGRGGTLTLPRYPASWLPPRAWADREIRAYVPSRYMVCYGGWPPSVVAPSRILRELPAPAADVLRSGYSGVKTVETPGTATPSEVDCSNLRTEEARALVDAFEDAGVEEGGPGNPWRLDYHFAVNGPNGVATTLIWFEPVLPDGEQACSRVCPA